MDIYKIASENVKKGTDLEQLPTDQEKIDLRNKIEKDRLYYKEQFKKIKFNNPLFKSYNITDTCNPVSCRLIIFFTDTLIPYFIQNIISQNPEVINKVIMNFTAVFNFIFYLIFDKYTNPNEKKWIKQQIDTLFKGLNKELLRNTIMPAFTDHICISLDDLTTVVKATTNCNFIMKISKEATTNSEDSPYYNDDVLLEELKEVLNRCLTFWEILPQEQANKIQSTKQIITTYKNSTNPDYDEIHFVPFIVIPNKTILFPIKEDIGIIIFNLFSNIEELRPLIDESAETEESNVVTKILSVYKLIRSIIDRINGVIQSTMPIKMKPADIVSIRKFIFCSYIFIALQSSNIFPKNKKYPETYDEMFTMFSDINEENFKERIPVYSKNFYDFFVPARSSDAPLEDLPQTLIQPPEPLPEAAVAAPLSSSTARQYQQTSTPQQPQQPQVPQEQVRLRPLPPGWEKFEKDGKVYYNNKEKGILQQNFPTGPGGGSRSTKKTSIKKRILKKPKKTIRNTK